MYPTHHWLPTALILLTLIGCASSPDTPEPFKPAPDHFASDIEIMCNTITRKEVLEMHPEAHVKMAVRLMDEEIRSWKARNIFDDMVTKRYPEIVPIFEKYTQEVGITSCPFLDLARRETEKFRDYQHDVTVLCNAFETLSLQDKPPASRPKMIVDHVRSRAKSEKIQEILKTFPSSTPWERARDTKSAVSDAELSECSLLDWIEVPYEADEDGY